MIELMKQYNALCKRYAKAEEYFAREDVSLIEKQGQAGNTKKLVDEMNEVITKIRNEGYEPTPNEFTHGFRQIKFLTDKGLI
jgi:hypothetical protein